jgi:predicted alpha/beta superfamily hydrolase
MRNARGGWGFPAGVLCFLSAAAAVRAKDADVREAVLPLTETYIQHSAISGRDYRISVARPLVEQAAQKYPVVYVLDADELFGLATETARLLEDDDEIPPVLVVGIGYPIRSFADAMGPRTTDFTVAVDKPYEQLVNDLTGGRRHVETGGAPAFLRFIREELKPFIASHYPVDPNDATIVGHSLGGLFGMYVLFDSTDTFSRYVIGSPCLRCGGSDLIKREGQYAGDHRDLAARLYMDIGSNEADIRRVLNIPPAMREAENRYLEAVGRPDGVAIFKEFTARLRSRHYRGLHEHTVVEIGEGHASLPPILLSRGLRSVFSSNP